MKFAFMSFSMPQASLAELLSAASTYGFHGIEPRLDREHGHGVEVAATAEQRQQIRQTAADAGVAICCLALSSRLADPTTQAETLAHLHDVIDLAGDLGCPTIRVFGGAFGDDNDRAFGIKQAADSFRQVASHAAERDVILAMETHDSWCDPAHVAAVMQAVDSPAIAVNWDIMHPVRIAKVPMRRAFDTLRPWIRHVHVHDGAEVDGKLLFRPIGEGIVDHAIAMACLKELDYDGYLSGEWINWEPSDVHLPRELASLRQIERGLA